MPTFGDEEHEFWATLYGAARKFQDERTDGESETAEDIKGRMSCFEAYSRWISPERGRRSGKFACQVD